MDKAKRKNTKDYPMLVGRIEIMKNYLGSRSEFTKALNFQLNALKVDMITMWEKQYGQSDG